MATITQDMIPPIHHYYLSFPVLFVNNYAYKFTI